MLRGMAHKEESKGIKHHAPQDFYGSPGGAARAKVQIDLYLCLLKISIYTVLSFSECFYMLSSLSVLHVD